MAREAGGPSCLPGEDGHTAAALNASAARARARCAWEDAASLHTQALSLSPGADTTREALDGRAECYRYLGDSPAESADLERLVRMCRESDDRAYLSRVLIRQAEACRRASDWAQGRALANEAIAIARSTGDRAVEVAGLLTLANICEHVGDYPGLHDYAEQGLTLSRAARDTSGEARALWALGYYYVRTGKPEQAQEGLLRSLEIYRAVGDREGEGNALNSLATASTDRAKQRAYLQQALALFEALGNRERIAVIQLNLAGCYIDLGLYGRAREYGEAAVAYCRGVQIKRLLSFAVGNLAYAYLGLGRVEDARRAMEESRNLALDVGDRPVAAGSEMDLGRIDLLAGNAAQARDRIKLAAETLEELGASSRVAALGFLGAAHLAVGEVPEALEATRRAAELLASGEVTSMDYPLHEAWWWRYQALRAAESAASGLPIGDADAVWQTIDTARAQMLSAVATLSDDGLRRNFFNKIAVNRQIIGAWLEEVERRGLPTLPLTDALPGGGSLPEQLKRMLDTGVRLNANRDPGGLPGLILDEVVELTGAERAVLVIHGEDGGEFTHAFAGLDLPLDEIAPYLAEVRHKQAPLLAFLPEGAAPLAQRSVLCVPLRSQGQLLGVVYVDLSGCYGRFTVQDRDLLAVLANQAAVALENAAWARTLEGRVQERTAELSQREAALRAANQGLEQRTAELEIINAVGQALAKQLDFASVVDVVGEKLHEVFAGQICFIALYDKASGLVSWPYWITSAGNRVTCDPAPLGPDAGMTSVVIESRAPLMLGTVAEQLANGAVVVDDGSGSPDQPESWLGVPILAGEDVTGAIAVADWPAQRYGESDQRLLSTLAASLGVALENARLFAETNRLLAETRQRAAELAIINRVGQRLAVQLETQDIYDVAGDELWRAFDAQVVQIITYDRETDLVHFRYMLEKGERQWAEPQAPGGFSGHILETREPLLIQRNLAERAAALGSVVLAGEAPKSYVGVPLIAGGEAIGVISLQNVDREDAFGEADLRLLGTVALNVGVALENARLFAEVQSKRAALEESQRQLSDIIAFLPDAIMVIDREGRVIAWNRAMEEMTGVPAAEMLGKGDHEYALPFYGERRPILVDLVQVPSEQWAARYSTVRKEGSDISAETYVPSLRGRPHFLYASASPLRDAEGNVVGAIEAIRDLSDRKRAEEELEEAKAAAEAANEAKSAFLAMMSHEIRTPMNAIIGMSGLLLDTQLSADQRDFAETIRSSGDALLSIINDILDFSKIEAGKMDLEEQPFDVRECLEAALDLLKLRAVEKGLELACQVEPEVPVAIVGDVTRLRQVLVNLLSNAVKFTDEGEIVVSVAARRAAAPAAPETCELHFAVRDTGIGIPPDRLDRLFRAFSQVDASTSRRYGGTGLGLAISKRLSELMGGRMWVESPGRPGQGSTFHFTVVAPVAPELKARPHLSTEQPRLRGKRVLVVDDNATNRRILVLQTRAWGMLARDTGSAGEALDWIRRGDPFDLAIVDMHMPEMDGTTLAGSIRALRPTNALPLVLCSSLGGREANVAPDLFAAYLPKPLKPSLLFDTLQTILAGRAEPEAKAAPVAPRMDSALATDHPLRILLAEDNLVNQKVALRLLAQMGYRADVAANGLEAIRSVERQPYDVVLMDVQMPEMDGLEASRQMCARWPHGERPHIIAMTANAMEGDREACLEAGMDDYVSKPVRVDELVDALGRARPRRSKEERQ